MKIRNSILIVMAVCWLFILHTAFAFEGQITAALTRGGQAAPLLYTVGTNFLRVEMTVTNAPNPVDILDQNSGELTLLFPNNRSFMRLPKNIVLDASPAFPVNPVSTPPQPGNIGPTNLPGTPPPPGLPQMPPGAGPQPAVPGALVAMPDGAGGTPAFAMPMRMPSMVEKTVLTATEEKTNLLGFVCSKYEIKQRGETMEVWATDKLFPFEAYMQRQPHRFGPRMIEEQWAGLLKTKKLFPLLATSKLPNGVERYRFEIKKIEPEKIEDKDGSLFQPPPDYHQIDPLPF